MKSKIENSIERMEIKMDLILDMLKEVSQPKYYYASNKTKFNSQDPGEWSWKFFTDGLKPTDYSKNTQEEWETMFDNLFYSSPSDLCIDKGELKALVRQLLSERSFSKEELVWIRNCVKRYGEEIEINEENSKIENAIFEKVNRLYRLLNLNNKRK